MVGSDYSSKLGAPKPDFDTSEEMQPTSPTLMSEPPNKLVEKYHNFRISEPFRFALLVLGAYAALLETMSNTYALFSNDMRILGNLSNDNLSDISTTMIAFSYFVLPYGYLSEYFGPKVVMVASTTVLSIGLLLMGLTFDGHIPAKTINFCVFTSFMGNGAMVFDIGIVLTVMDWFPTHHGETILVMKTLAGLGSGVFATVQLALFDGNPSGFFYFLLGLSLIFGIGITFIIRLPPYKLTIHQRKTLSDEEKEARALTRREFMVKEPPRQRFYIATAVVVFLIVFMPLQSALIVYLNLSKSVQYVFLTIIIVALACMPISILPFKCLGGMDEAKNEELRRAALEEEQEELEALQLRVEQMQKHTVHTEPYPHGDEREDHSDTLGEHPHSPHPTLLNDDAEAVANDEQTLRDLEFVAPQYQTSFLHNLCTIELWLLYAGVFCVMGGMMMNIFQYPVIAAAVRGKRTDTEFRTLMATLASVGSSLGRLGISFGQVITQRGRPEERIPLTILVFIPPLLTILGFMFYLILPGDGVVMGNLFVSMGVGSQTAIAPIIFRGVYVKDIALHFSAALVMTMASAILVNRGLFGLWYSHAAKQPGTKLSPDGMCLEKRCVLMPLLVLIALGIVAIGLSVVVHILYRRYCRRVIDEYVARQAVVSERGTEKEIDLDDEMNGFPEGVDAVEEARNQRAWNKA